MSNDDKKDTVPTQAQREQARQSQTRTTQSEATQAAQAAAQRDRQAAEANKSTARAKG